MTSAFRAGLGTATLAAMLLAFSAATFGQTTEPAAPHSETGASQSETGASQGEPVWRHGSSLIGEPGYPEGFPHFDYVNPQAPKGGALRLSASGTFDTLNPIVARGVPAAGVGIIYDTLLSPALDEQDISAAYGLLAEAFSYPEDRSSVTYRLREEARWHDGEPVTVEDVIWSFAQSKEHNPQLGFYYANVERAEETGEREVTFFFAEKNNRELPQILGQMPILPKHWWEAEGQNGAPRNIGETTLEPPLGSGPYKIAEVVPGRSIVYERVEDYWGADLPVNVGSHNFGTLTYEYYGDRSVEFEAFKAGRTDFWVENEARRWATAYDFPAVNDGQIVLEEFENYYSDTGRMTGFVPNLRREKFADIRVREALSLLFDFEELNRTIFFDQYERITSFFHGTELASSGLPEGRELEILQEVSADLPPEILTEPYEAPVGGSNEAMRDNYRRAVQLMKEAGYELRGNAMVNAETGEPFTIEILLDVAFLERVALPYAQSLQRIGIDATVRTVDESQYQQRLRTRDFDMVYEQIFQTLSPGNEQLEYWGSVAADREGSQNYAGIDDPAVDALIKKVIFASDRDDLVAATKALDRVLLAGHYFIPSYASRYLPVAYRSNLAHPEPLPTYGIGFPSIWWSKDAEGTEG